MRHELVQSKGAIFIGIFAGMICFLIVYKIGVHFPAFTAQLSGGNWISYLVLGFCVGVGGIAMALRRSFITDQINKLDDDMLKFQHDKMSRDKLRSNIISYIAIALVVAYLIFKR